MKLTNPELIQESEKEFIDTINAELDWDAIEQMLLEKHGFTVQEDVDYKDGNLIVHKNEIAYKFEFEIKVPLSVIFNRTGECLEISTQGDDEDDFPDGEDSMVEASMDDPTDDPTEDPTEDPIKDSPGIVVKPQETGRSGQMASEIVDMISEINEQGE